MIDNTAVAGGKLVRVIDPERTVCPNNLEMSAGRPLFISPRSGHLASSDVRSQTSGRESQNEEPAERQVYEDEIVVDKTMAHILENSSYSFAVRLYEYRLSGHPWEPMEHFPQTHFVRYFRTKKLKLPPRRALRTAMPGWRSNFRADK